MGTAPLASTQLKKQASIPSISDYKHRLVINQCEKLIEKMTGSLPYSKNSIPVLIETLRNVSTHPNQTNHPLRKILLDNREHIHTLMHDLLEIDFTRQQPALNTPLKDSCQGESLKKLFTTLNQFTQAVPIKQTPIGTPPKQAVPNRPQLDKLDIMAVAFFLVLLFYTINLSVIPIESVMALITTATTTKIGLEQALGTRSGIYIDNITYRTR